MATTFRLFSLCFGVFYLTVCWIWVYGFALLGVPLGVLGLICWGTARKIEGIPIKKAPEKKSLDKAVLYINSMGFITSFVSLILWGVLAK